MAPTRPKVLVIGSSNTDLIIQTTRIPRPGETVLGGSFTKAAGGKGANQAVAAARAGGDVIFIARVGSDTHGDQAVKGFLKDGIDVAHIIRDPQNPSGVALIFVGADGENSIAVASGANDFLTPTDIRKARGLLRQTEILLLQLETPLPAVEEAAALAASAGVRAVLNPAPAQPLPHALLRNLHLLTPNETEAELLTGIAVTDDHSAREAALELLDRGVKNVIITRGSRGCFVAGDGIGEVVPGLKVNPVDTTGAGDVFSGSLCVALAAGESLIDAARFATAAAAISVTRLGAQPSAPARGEIQKALLTGRIPAQSTVKKRKLPTHNIL